MDSYDERTNPRPGARQPAVRRSAEASAGSAPRPGRPGAHPDAAGADEHAERPASQQPPAQALPAQEPSVQGPPVQEPPESPLRKPQARQPTVPHPSAPQPPAPRPAPGTGGAAPGAGSAASGAAGTAPGGGEAGPGRSGPPPGRPDTPRTGINGLSFRYQVIAAVALACIGVVVCVHLLMVFLHVAPSNTATKQHGQVVNEWVLPEFEQNWKLFAPNPLQQNIAVEARAQVRTASGEVRTTGWYNFSALDGAAIDGNLLPSHTQQNELRRAWDFFVAAHDNQNRPVGSRGTLSEGYLRRIMVLRLSRAGVGGQGSKDVVESVQVRSMTTNVQPPPWSGNGKVSNKPFYRTLSWWPVSPGDLPLNAAAAARPQHVRTEAEAR